MMTRTDEEKEGKGNGKRQDNMKKKKKKQEMVREERSELQCFVNLIKGVRMSRFF